MRGNRWPVLLKILLKLQFSLMAKATGGRNVFLLLMQRHCVVIFSLFSPNDLLVSNVVWLSAHIGSGYYIYTRQHVQRATPWLRAAYSVSGAVLFNFGTVLFWATAKQVLPANDALRTLFGLASGAAFLTVARRYLEFVDSSVTSSAAVTAE